MKTQSSSKRVETAIAHLKKSASGGNLVAVIGTGVSMALTDGKNRALSWKGLIENGFAYGVTKGKITREQKEFWKSQLDSDDLDDLLSAAEFMGRKLDAPKGDLYARWLKSVFEDVTPENNAMAKAIRALHSAEIPLCTLNYDPLLERVTGLAAVNFAEISKVVDWMSCKTNGVLHFHGSWDAPSTCILGIRDYEATVSNDVRDLIQRSLSSFGRLLFIGCGDTFADPNFMALIKWLRDRMKTAVPQHYALVNASEEACRHADPSWHGFVEPISYGAHHKDLPTFLLKQFPTMVVPKSNKKTNRSNKDSIAVAKHAKVLEEYRAFLIHDCGQMTIEGIRADMDTAQRRFDLERLFVPLKVLPTPPEIPASDPEREQNLLKWQAENKDPLPFGPIFRNHKHLALLALPGGGKTLLLKRLAVAYADPTRRKSSNDDLPAFDILPILIRCREWKEHIRRPIPVLLKHIAEITGKTTLADLDDALVPLLKKGRVLLLVDGLDEIHNDADRSTFVEHLEAFLDEYKLIRLVVTSREAGFSLVAPSIARFCERWRVASLEPDAVRALCSHWHRLMTGDSPESFAEANDVAERLLGNDSLRHLAENPLLLTMLLVVKHGAGRLPPDRVSLYGRAVEVLLDTWNIKGHEPLNLKEAVPQLACVAFELMRKGKQTATEKELLILLEEARERVPQIRRYAKDTPSAFLKRVELRSSLLVEAGHQLEATRAVSFYQFRHLTFQEYLAAVAAVDGHYMEYQKDDTVTTPLTPYLTTEEWKDVIPMAAVLARKQAEPLIAALVDEGNSLRQRVEQGKESVGRRERINYPHKLPSAIARIVQCLIEEADAAPETLIAALQLVALFARSCWSSDNWQALSRGPYGEELLHQTWLLYAPMKWPIEFLVRNTFARLAWFRKPLAHWESADGQNELMHLLQSRNYEEIVRGLLIPPAVLWGQSKAGRDWVPILADIEAHLFNDDRALWGAAAWAWGRIRNVQKLPLPSHAVLDRLLSLCLVDDGQGIAAYALVQVAGLPRHAWTPVLTGQQRDFYRQVADNNSGGPDESPEYGERRAYELAASLMVGFHSWDLWPEKELAKRLRMFGKGQFAASIKAMLEQINLVIEKKHPLKKRRTKS